MRNWTRVPLAACFLGSALTACFSVVDDGGGSVGGYYYGGGGPDGGEGTDGGGSFGDGAPSAMPLLVKIDPNATLMQSPGQGVGVFVQYDATSASDPGGHWYVWWTCDTSMSNEPCDFSISVSLARGDITNATAEGFGPGDTLTGGGAEIGPLDGGPLDGALDAGPLDAGPRDAGAAPDGGRFDGGTSASASSGSAASSASGDGSGTGSAAPGSTSAITADTTTTTTVQGVHFDTAPGAIITLSAALGGDYSGRFLFFVQDGQVNGGYAGMLSDPLELQPSSP